MKTYTSFLAETLSIAGDYKGTVFQRLVAARYMTMPVHSERDDPAWSELAKKFARQKEFLSSKYRMEPTQEDPYASMADMTRKIEAQKAAGIKPAVRVFSALPGPEGEAESQGHPVWDNDINVVVRWVHDIIAHYYGQHKFSARGEYAAYNRHTKTLGPTTLASKALFTEVVAQTSCYYVYGNYVPQKVCLMTELFDHLNIGKLAPGSPLNKYFEFDPVEKNLIPVENFNDAAFLAEFPGMGKELRRQWSLKKSLVPLQPIFSDETKHDK